ncbi:MAG: NAD(P)/FAD-dependent oxidoreductase [Burkholderiales bacterium]|nr:NAD(P)/FAD-dependent oxidoreductase [Burkholderiales bacterium]
MMCAAQAGQRGRRVLLIEHADKLGERIRISGGGRCNFTNREVSAANYLSQNPHFCRSALAQYSQHDFVALVEHHRIPFEERDHGQLFCVESATRIIDMLKRECDQGGVQWAMPCKVEGVQSLGGNDGTRFSVNTSQGNFHCQSLVIASGGLAAPKLGATPFGYQIAEQFGLPVIPPKPALVPLALAPEILTPLQPLSGVSIEAMTKVLGGKQAFREHVLITHRGLSGPAILQISSYWQMQEYAEPGVKKQPIAIALLPGLDVNNWLAEHRHAKALLATLLAEKVPRRFAQEWCQLHGWTKPMAEFSNKEINTIAQALQGWPLMPAGTLGYNKAEVTLGGVDARALNSKNMEAETAPGLFFIGEVVDVTGWLGGYNFQWAWSSGWVAGQAA